MTRADTLGIVGAGWFGTALAHVVSLAGRRVVVWTSDSAVARAINDDHTNPRLPDLTLSERVRATDSPRELADAARLIVIAVASTEVRDRARALGDRLTGRHLLVHAIGALAAPGDVPVSEVLLAETPVLRVGALAGPALWRDLLGGAAPGAHAEHSASMVVASRFDEVAVEARRLLAAPPALRVYRGSDLRGVELASALSGAYTMAVGLADAIGVGPGTRAVLITRALAEASRLGEASGAQPRTFAGLAGLGNLLVRTGAEHSRDYQLGRALSRGELPAPEDRSEGARAALAGDRLARRLEVHAPVLGALAAIVRGDATAAEAAAHIADSVAQEE